MPTGQHNNKNMSGLKRTAGPGRPKGSKSRLSRERVELELRRLATLDVRQVFERYKDPATGRLRRFFTLREVHDMDDDTRACIASVKVRTENLSSGDGEQDQTIEVRFWDKVKALELCGRALAMFTDKHEISAPEELISRLDRAKVRARQGNGE